MLRHEFDTAEEYELADCLHPDDVATLVNVQLQQLRDEAAQDGEALDENFTDYLEALDRVAEAITAVIQEEKKDREDGYDNEIDRSSSTAVAMELAMHMLKGNPEALDVVEEMLQENADKREQQPRSRGRFEEVELQRRNRPKPEFHDRGF